jgi:hypothetical protein
VSRRSTSIVRPDGRVRLRVEIPAEVADFAAELARHSGLDHEAVVGDLAAVGLPGLLAELADGALAESARKRLQSLLTLDAEMPPHHSVGGIPGEVSQPNAVPSITAGRPESEPVSGGT